MFDLTPDERTKLVGRVILLLIATGILIYSVFDHLWFEAVAMALLLLSQWLSFRRALRRRA